MAYGPNGYIRVPSAIERVEDALWQFATARRPSVRALKLTGATWHPSKVG